MTQSSRCPSDRSELLLVLENRATEAMRAHVESCDECRLEVQELGNALELISLPDEAPPSERVRRDAVAYARSQLGSRQRTPSANGHWWTTPAATIAGVVRREIFTRALIGAVAFSVLVLAFPIPRGVELSTAWTLGSLQVSPGGFWSFAVISSLYGALPAAVMSWVRDAELSWAEACWSACVFAVLASPMLLAQAGSYPPIASVGCLACGAWMSERLMRLLRRR